MALTAAAPKINSGSSAAHSVPLALSKEFLRLWAHVLGVNLADLADFTRARRRWHRHHLRPYPRARPYPAPVLPAPHAYRPQSADEWPVRRAPFPHRNPARNGDARQGPSARPAFDCPHSTVTVSVSAYSLGVDAYLLCGTPRTGSTLLCGLLRSTDLAGRPESYFRLPDEQAWADRWQLPRNGAGAFDYGDYVRAAVAAGSSPNGVFGARVMWGTMEQIVTKLSIVHPDFAGADLELLTRAFGRIRFVHLRRDDTVAQAVSWTRAEQTHFWQDGETVLPGGHEPRFDFQQIHALVQTIDEHNVGWRTGFAMFEVQPYLVRYEDLAADPAGVTRGVFDFLGLHLSADPVLAPGTRRQGDRINHDWIAQYRAMAG